jgi:hypothetical protein
VKRGLKQYKDIDVENDPRAQAIRAKIIDEIDSIGYEGKWKDHFPRKSGSGQGGLSGLPNLPK